MKTRIVALICAVSMLFALPVFAYEEQEYQRCSGTSGLIESLANDTGWEADGFDKETVTRGEFVLLLAQLLTKGSMEEADCGFSDVQKGSKLSYALHYAENAGIVSKGDTFEPNEAIKRIEAEKMAVCALGYQVKAEVLGGYPLGYTRIARDISISDGVSAELDDSIGSQEAYMILNNMLEANIYSIYSISGEVAYYNTTDTTLLETLYDVVCIDGVVSANEYTSLTDANGDVGKGRIRVGTDVVSYNGKEDYLGYGVKAYVKDFDGKRECLYVQPYETDVVEFSGREYNKTEDGRIYIETDGKTNKLNMNDSAVYVYNNKAITAQQAKDLTQGHEYRIKLIDYDADGSYDCVMIKQYRYCLVKSIDTYKKIIVDENGANGTIKLPDDGLYRIYGTYKGGEVSSFDEIQIGMLLAAAVSGDGSVVDIYVCDDTRNITVASVSDSEKVFGDADGNDYDYGEYFDGNYRTAMTFNTPATVLFGINGEAVVGQFKDSGAYYGWVVARSSDYERGWKDLQLKIYTEKGKMQVFNVHKNVYINGVKPTASIDAVIDSLGDDNRLIKYTLNNEGQIRNIDIAENYDGTSAFPNYSDEKNSLTLFYDGRTQTMQYHENSAAFTDKFNVGEAVVFVVPKNADSRNDEMEYSIGIGNLINDQYYNVMAYDLNQSLQSGAIVVLDDLSNTSNVTTGGVVVQEVYQTLDEENDRCYGLSVYNNGEYQYLHSNEYTEADIKNLKNGDIVRLRISGNTVTGIKREYSFESDSIIQSYDEGSNFDWLKGLVYDISGNTLSIIKDAKTVPTQVSYSQLKNMKIPNSVAYIYINKNRDGSVKSAVVRPTLEQNIHGAATAGNEASFAVVQRKNYRAERMFIYIVND